MVGPFVASIFSSAFLLFLVQPLTAKLLLPGYGGSPAVWNTALVFFQLALLAGYLYAFGLARLRSIHLQLGVHAVVLLLPLFALPIVVGGAPDPTAAPTVSMFTTLALGIGLPFFVLATNSSLMQFWYSSIGDTGSDPYWMYSASNVGSLLALILFPLVLEPFVASAEQVGWWTVGYGLFLALTAAAMLARARAPGALAPSDRARERASTVSWRKRLDWIVRAAVGSSLLLAVTMKITTEVGSVPLLWTVPLALYLVTFILAFGWADRIPMDALVAAVCVAACAGLGLVLIRRVFSFEVVLIVGLLLLFLGALLCHTDLARTRPNAAHLTEFYLWISAGGALGGVLNSLVAPVVFDSVAEYPITLAALLWLAFFRPSTDHEGHRRDPPQARFFRPSFLTALLCTLGLGLSVVASVTRSDQTSAASLAVALLGAAMVAFVLRRYLGFVALVPTLAAGLSFSGVGEPYPLLALQRSFFGVSRVWETPDRVLLVHGSTVHGSQLRALDQRRQTGTYYYPAGPLGSAVQAAPDGATIGIVGLGAGELAALGQAGQQMFFYEIDPVVIELAHRHFTYLDDSEAEITTVLGDGRLSLAASDPGSHDLIIVDAFSSDNIPMHLLTQEALRMYLDRLRPDGVLMIHASSRHADLRRVLKGFSQTDGVPVLLRDFSPTAAQVQDGAVRTIAVALARSEAPLDSLRRSGMWGAIPGDVATVHWSDDRSSLLQVLSSAF